MWTVMNAPMSSFAYTTFPNPDVSMEATKLPLEARRPVVRYLPLPREARHLIDQFLLQTHPAAALMSAVTIEERDGPHDDIPAGNVKFLVIIPNLRMFVMDHPSPSPDKPRYGYLSRVSGSVWPMSIEYGEGENYFTLPMQQRREEFIARMYLEDAGR